MAVRVWNDDNSEVRIPVAASAVLGTSYTIAVLLKPNAKSNWESIVCGHDAAGDDQWQFGFNPSNVPIFYVANGNQTNAAASGSVASTTTWYVVVVTRDGDDYEFSMFPFGGAWAHVLSDLGGAQNAPTSTTGGHMSVGAASGVDDLSARVAALGLWTAPMTTGQREALTANLRTADWTGHTITPAGVWQFNQAGATDPVPDLMGVHDTVTGTITGLTDHNGIDGTTIATDDDPPGWTFTTVSEPAETLALPAVPSIPSLGAR